LALGRGDRQRLFELIDASDILWRPTRRTAGLGLMARTVAVTPAHIYMLQQPELFGVLT
jgi:uncharacterized membrane protein